MPDVLAIGSLDGVLAATSIALAAVRSLDDSNSSIVDCLDLTAELNTLESTLKVIYQTMTLQFQQNQIFADIINDITRRCRRDMEKFCDNVGSYHKGRSRRGPRRWAYKILWTIWKKSEVIAFRGKISRYQARLNTCLQFQLLCVQLAFMQNQEC